MTNRREWPSRAYRTAHPAPSRRVTPARRAEKRRESLAMALACMALLVAVWALLIAAAARDALMIVGVP